METPISELGLSARARGCLYWNGIKTVKDLVQNREGDLMNLIDFGYGALSEVKTTLSSIGLRLSE